MASGWLPTSKTCAGCSTTIIGELPISLPCSHSFHRHCIPLVCPICPSPSPGLIPAPFKLFSRHNWQLPVEPVISTFDDDEPLPSNSSPMPADGTSSSSPRATATIKTFTEFPAPFQLFRRHNWQLPVGPVISTFDDDEPLPSNSSPMPADGTSSSSPRATATIKTFTEFPAVAASDSPSAFTVLVKARAPPSPPGRSASSRSPLDLVAVLDVSESMSGRKIALLKRAVRFIVHTLGPSDRLSLVTFSTNARRVLNLRLMSHSGRAQASFAVDSLVANGNTNIKAGLDTGVRVLNERTHRNPVAGIILLSDGQDNCSSFRSHDFRHLLPDHAAPIHTFGFGSDHDPKALHAISVASGGTFSFIEAEEFIQDAFAMCIAGLLSVVAQQAEIMVSSASAGVCIASVSSGSYTSKIINHGLAAAIEVGDLYADEEKDFLVRVSVPPKGQQDGVEMRLQTVKCSYKDPLTQGAVHVVGEDVVIRRPESLSPEDKTVSLVVDGQRNRILAAECMKEAQGRADKGDLEGAKAVLTSGRSALLASPAAQSGDQLCQWLEAELAEIQKRMENTHVYERSGRAYCLSGVRSHMTQRAAGGEQARTASAFRRAKMIGGSGEALNFGGAEAKFVGYQTQAMQDMVQQSKQYARENPFGTATGRRT